MNNIHESPAVSVRTFCVPTSDREPLKVFLEWFAAAQSLGVHQPEAMALATSTLDAQPSVRMVLYKGLSENRIRFFTNDLSRKGREIQDNPNAALLFWWNHQEKQVRVEGQLFPLKEEESEEYFHSRPRRSQLGSAFSQQSHPIESHDAWRVGLEEFERSLEGKEVPRPSNWHGYAMEAVRWEFWSGEQNRLHERYQFDLQRDGTWRFTLLAP